MNDISQTEDIQVEYTEPLWNNDTGDMDAQTRDALAALITQPFVTTDDNIRGHTDISVLSVILADEQQNQLIRRDLDNLGRELIIKEKLGIAYARQRDEVDTLDIRRTARKRTVRENAQRGMLDADILFMALKLRNHFDDARAKNATNVRVSEEELYRWFKTSPSSRKLQGNAEAIRRAFDRCIDACKQNTTGIGLITKVPGIDIYTVLPTVLILVNDKFATQIADMSNTDTNQLEESSE